MRATDMDTKDEATLEVVSSLSNASHTIAGLERWSLNEVLRSVRRGATAVPLESYQGTR